MMLHAKYLSSTLETSTVYIIGKPMMNLGVPVKRIFDIPIGKPMNNRVGANFEPREVEI
jgi:hypothetical protein